MLALINTGTTLANGSAYTGDNSLAKARGLSHLKSQADEPRYNNYVYLPDKTLIDLALRIKILYLARGTQHYINNESMLSEAHDVESTLILMHLRI